MNVFDKEFEDFYRDNVGRLWGYLYRSVETPPDLIDDLVMDAFLATRRCWDHVRTGAPKAYLFVVARRESIRRQQRRYQREEPHADIPMIHGPRLAPDLVGGLIDRLALQAALERLPRSQREAVALRYREGFSIAETAMIMSVAPGTVKRYACDGLRHLRELFTHDTASGEVD